jgi:hypothetical protein
MISGRQWVVFLFITSGSLSRPVTAQGGQLVINEIVSANITGIHDEYDADEQNCPVPDCEWWYDRMGRSTEDGDYPDWIEIYNKGLAAVDLNGYALSDDSLSLFKWVFPSCMIAPGGYLLVFASGKDRKDPTEVETYMHTNFKIDRKGESLFLTDNTGKICDGIAAEEIPVDFSLGRYPDGGGEWVIFDQPTPAESNTTPPFPGFTDSVQVSCGAGFYSGGISLSLSARSSTSEIVYTLDGNDPARHSSLYTHPISVNQTAVLKARTYENGTLSSKILTQTYFIDETATLPVISLSTNPDNFWDDDTGIYVPGSHADENNRIANYWQDWERPIDLEFFEPPGVPAFSFSAGAQIFGWGSRQNALKSLSIMLRDRYGRDKLEYPLFPEPGITEFSAFVLRTAGNDWQNAYFRDLLCVSLTENINLDKQSFRPAVVYLNGAYWGIHHIREKLNEDYLASHHHIDKNNVDIISRYWRRQNPVVIEGDDQAYLALEDYLHKHDLNNPGNYEYIKSVMDVDNYIDYCTAQIYIANYDWPGNNNKCWRPRIPGAKWRWLFYDLDYTFNSHGINNYTHNTLEHATTPFGSGWPNPPSSTFLLRKLLENQEFRNLFINRMADFMNTIFLPDTVINRIDEIKAILEPEMPRHIGRWGSYGSTLKSLDDWENNIDVLRDFAANRGEAVRRQYCSQFNLAGSETLTLNVSLNGSGKIRINSIVPESTPWTGDYFAGIPLEITALAKPGQRFAHWKGIPLDDSLSSTIIVHLDGPSSLTACFESDHSLLTTIVINEINYNSSPEFDPDDWIELYNPYSDPVDISGWYFKDSDDSHCFTFPEKSSIESDDYLILCRNEARFQTLFPGILNTAGDLNFGLDADGELIRLFNARNEIVDSLTYGTARPWPEEPDGNGPTLSLSGANLDNAMPQSWGSSLGYGTPGAVNENSMTRISHEAPNTGLTFKLEQNFPNPFNPQTSIHYELEEASQVRLEIISLAGQKIVTLVDAGQQRGAYTIVWDGKDSSGKNAASGLYIAGLKAVHRNGTAVMSRKMLLLK